MTLTPAALLRFGSLTGQQRELVSARKTELLKGQLRQKPVGDLLSQITTGIRSVKINVNSPEYLALSEVVLEKLTELDVVTATTQYDQLQEVALKRQAFKPQYEHYHLGPQFEKILSGVIAQIPMPVLFVKYDGMAKMASGERSDLFKQAFQASLLSRAEKDADNVLQQMETSTQFFETGFVKKIIAKLK